MKLFTATPSPFARKVSVALLEKGIPFETVIDLPWNADSQAPNLNPLGKIPILLLEFNMLVPTGSTIYVKLSVLFTINLAYVMMAESTNS